MFDLIGRALNSLYQVSRGLATVGKHTFREPTTKPYPDEMPDLPAEFRGRLALTVNPETGENLCISCRQCERVCPDKCIEITAHKSPETNKLELIDFRIDHGLCMFCGLCTEVCPTYCIINTNDFEMADYTRESLIYDLKKLTLSQEESAYYFEKKELPLPKPKPAKAAPVSKVATQESVTKAAAQSSQPAAAAEPNKAQAADDQTKAIKIKPDEQKSKEANAGTPGESDAKPSEGHSHE